MAKVPAHLEQEAAMPQTRAEIDAELQIPPGPPKVVPDGEPLWEHRLKWNQVREIVERISAALPSGQNFVTLTAFRQADGDVRVSATNREKEIFSFVVANESP